MTVYVATIIAGGCVDLDDTMVIQFRALLRAHKGEDVHSQWIRAGKAVDVFCGGLTPETIHKLFKVSIPAQAFDIIVQPASNRRKKILIADMESTIIEQEMLDEIANLLGLHSRIADITRRAMNGELDFAKALDERVKLLAGEPVTRLAEAAKTITIMPGAEALISAMKKHGVTCWLVSGGFTYFTDIIATRLGFDKAFANHLVIEDGKIAGTVRPPILDKNSKKDYLEQACREQGLTLADCLCIGDGANDIPMLEACNAGGGLGIAYHGKPNVRAGVQHQINYADLSALVDVQGIG